MSVDNLSPDLIAISVTPTDLSRQELTVRFTRPMSVDEMNAVHTVLLNARASVPPKEANDGELWSFLRSVLSQGGDIWLDHKESSYERYSARLDVAARELIEKLRVRLSVEPVAANNGDSTHV